MLEKNFGILSNFADISIFHTHSKNLTKSAVVSTIFGIFQ